MTSCLLIRWSRRQRIRDQARSAAATVTRRDEHGGDRFDAEVEHALRQHARVDVHRREQDDLLADQHHHRHREQYAESSNRA